MLIGIIERILFGASSCVLCREAAVISELPLSEISLYIYSNGLDYFYGKKLYWPVI